MNLLGLIHNSLAGVSEDTLLRFFMGAYLDRIKPRLVPDGDCLLWSGTTTRGGYGCVEVRAGERPVAIGTHRLVLSLSLGRMLGAEEKACHKCDRPKCCNPDHLFAGSHTDNMRDMLRKGRFRNHHTSGRTQMPHGNGHYCAKLSLDIIKKAAADIEVGAVSLRARAIEVGVHHTTLRDAIRGNTWRRQK